MKKDIVIAIGIGFAVGGIAAITAINSPNLLKKITSKKESNPVISVTPAVIKVIENSIKLEITSPIDQYLSANKSIDISGKTNPQTLVLLEDDIDLDSETASTDGSFTGKLTISEGVNHITATVYGENGSKNSKDLTVYYTSEKI